MPEVKRLKKNFTPKHYDLQLDLYRQDLRFEGRVRIEGELPKETDHVLLHGKDLRVTSAKSGTSELQVDYTPEEDVIRLSADKPMKGDVTLELKFTGQINQQLHGIYPSRFMVDGQEHVAFATQFESHHAREAFPCIDEPDAKATFQLTLTSDESDAFISNTNEMKRDTKNGRTTVTFDKTPKMSSYLLAFVAGNLESESTKNQAGKTVTVWTAPGKVKQARFALDVGAQTLDYFEEYFDIEYPLDKCDLIAIPDFVTGAMENWGCVLFRETAMLVDENTSQTGKQWVAEVVAHELAHQWFGNLVTMEWWTDLWLNEGFATWVANLAVDHLFPEWGVWTDFVIGETFRGQDLDALTNSHPVQVDIKDPDEIRAIFDAISYNKGGALLDMLQAYLGQETFREGLRQYLKTHAYGNARTADLWKALADVSGKPVESFMATWTEKTGFPYLSVEQDDSATTIRQQRYLSSGQEPDEQTVWPVPLLTNQQDAVIDTKEKTFTPALALPLNHNRRGFYFTHYDQASLRRIGKMIDDHQLNELDRLGVLHETAQLSMSGQTDSVEALELMAANHTEESARVWQVMSGFLGDIRRVFDDKTTKKQLRGFVTELIGEHTDMISFIPEKDEDHNRTLLRPTLLGLALFARMQPFYDDALSMTDKYLQDTKHTIHADVKGAVLNTAARQGGMELYQKFLRRYKETESVQEKMKLAAALCSFHNQEALEQSRELLKTDDVRNQDVYFWIAYLFSNPFGKHHTWQWLKDNWDWLSKTFSSDIATFAYLPKFAASSFSDEDFAQEYLDFFERAHTKGIDRQVEQGLETIRWQARWKQRDQKKLNDWLKRYTK